MGRGRCKKRHEGKMYRSGEACSQILRGDKGNKVPSGGKMANGGKLGTK